MCAGLSALQGGNVAVYAYGAKVWVPARGLAPPRFIRFERSQYAMFRFPVCHAGVRKKWCG